jgi:ABC-type glycerol-3-phosphate transport system permease component
MRTGTYSALEKAAVYTFLIALFAITLFPVVYAFLSSLKTNQEILVGGIRIFPRKIVWQNYSEAWKTANFRRFTFNSLYMTALIVIGTMLSATMLGYVFSRAAIKGKNIIFAVMVATMFISLGSMTLYPLTRLARVIGINKGLWGVIIIRVLGLNIPCIYLVRNYLETISSEIDQAARIDGCSFFRIYWNIILPLMQPIVATVGLIMFMFAWNDYLLPLVFTLANPDWEPLVVGVARLKSSGGQAASSWNIMMAGTMISVVPMIVVYLILNRYFIAGLTEGSLKG